jgi:hypothetical protein
MHRPLSRLPVLLLASAFAVSAAAAPRDAATGQATGQRMHKPFKVTTQVVDCAPANAQPANVASDPEEGGQVTAARSTSATNVQPTNVASDPEEGGQVTAAAKTAKPSVSEIHVTKPTDSSSPKLVQGTPSGSGSCP